ncbi:hypothetical protein M878_43645 [Streptomyces roseochromogenus subsp. oscitans DS 12.976]|uniref:Uncharacterized protein n=1 Tax=Streptomyces roseochromogenus subsp. oscitans DS 12.976 TaxID=1352936 RepID=V6JI51_STRRC|nr:hypothetical protein M878_43645 [Streptomyces roseochromogenus subsp. oscitans DS 12.976]
MSLVLRRVRTPALAAGFALALPAAVPADARAAGGSYTYGVGATWDAPTGVQAFGVRLGSTLQATRGARS